MCCLANDISIYREKVLEDERAWFTRSHVMARLLNFEATLKNMVPMLVPCPLEWLNTLNMFLLIL